MNDAPGIEDRMCGDDYYMRLRLDRLTRLLDKRRHAREQFLAAKTATVADLPGASMPPARAERTYRSAHRQVIAQCREIADNNTQKGQQHDQ